MRTRTLVSALFVLVGCTPDLTPGSYIDRNRVIDAKVVIDGDLTRATPRAGEAVHVDWLVVDEAEPRPLTWILAACNLNAAQSGVDLCGGTPFAFAQQMEPSMAVPSLPLELPADSAGGRILVLGVICGEGTPSFDMTSMSGGCSVKAQETPVVYQFNVAAEDPDAELNHHPDFANAALKWNNEPWPESGELPLENCETARHEGVPFIDGGGKGIDISLTFALEEFESYTRVFANGPTQPAVEGFQLSQFATAKKFERQYSFVNNEAPETLVEWTPPKAKWIPDGGLLVRFFFVARDLRGGTAWTERAACVRKP